MEGLNLTHDLSFQLLASGGVDSTVCALLLNKALPASQIITVHIDNGEYEKQKDLHSKSVETKAIFLLTCKSLTDVLV